MLTRLTAALIVIALVTTACGSQLTEEEILDRSAVAQDPSSATGGSVGADTATSDAPATGPDAGDDRAAPAPTEPGGADSEAASPNDQSAASDTGGGDGDQAADTGGGDGDQAADAETGGDTGAGDPSAEAGCTTEDTGPIVVGSVGNYSGAAGAAHQDFPKAVQIWANMINRRGGLCGREVQVIVEDDGGDPAQYGSLVRELVENRNVIAFVGNGASLSHEGGIDYHNQSGVPVFGNDCSTDAWFNSPVLAPTCAKLSDVLVGLLQTAVDITGSKELGYLYCAEARACQDVDRMFVDGAVENAGAELVYREQVSLSQVDFTAECQSARDAGTEIFSVGADPATIARAAKSCAQQEWFPQWIGLDITFTADTIREPGLEDILVGTTTFPFAGASGGAIDEYNQAVQTFAPNEQGSPALSVGWTGAKLFELVARRAAESSGSITPEALVDALHTVKDETLDGLTVPLTFGPDGANPPSCYFAIQGDGTGEGFELPFGSEPRCL